MRSALSPSDIWSALHGVICVHKPRDVSLTALKKILICAICSDANNSIPPRQPPIIEMPIVEPHPKSHALLIVGMRKQLDYSSHSLVVGEPFRKEDIRVEELHYLEPASSGVCLFGINDGCEQLESLRERAWVNEYRLMGQLGRETYMNEIRGKVVMKCAYADWRLMITKCFSIAMDGKEQRYVVGGELFSPQFQERALLKKLLSRVQAQYKRLAFELANVDLQSQEAFELARKGLPRAKVLGTPIVYGIGLNSFKAPHFSLTLSCVSETDSFLRGFVREVAISLGTTASCRRLLCVRVGPFDSEHSLLDKHFTLSNILTNMQICRQLIEKDAAVADESVVQDTPHVAINELLKDQLIETLDEEPQKEVVDDCLRIAWGREYTEV